MAERFFIAGLLEPGLVVLQGPEAHHLASVSRIRLGDRVFLFNGDGREYPAAVLEIQKRKVALEVQEPIFTDRELPFHLEVAAPLPKGDRAQFLVEKLTELGVSSFFPLSTYRSVVHPREAKLEKLERYVIEAGKQCGRNVLMKIGPLTSLESYIQAPTDHSLKLMADPSGKGLAETTNRNSSLHSVALVIGPEGGFTEEEISLANAGNWTLINLGPRILRVETAALVLATLVISGR